MIDFKASTIYINSKLDNRLNHERLTEISIWFALNLFSCTPSFVIYGCPSDSQGGVFGNRMYWSGMLWNPFYKSIWFLWSQFKHFQERNRPILFYRSWNIDFVLFSTKVDFYNYDISVVIPLQTQSLHHAIEYYLSWGCCESICNGKVGFKLYSKCFYFQL